VLVVGDAKTLKVHLHTDQPELATAVFAEAGEVSRLDVADMRLQVDERDARLTHEADAHANGAAHAGHGAAALVHGNGANGANGSSKRQPVAARRGSERRNAERRSADGQRAKEGSHTQSTARCGAVAVVSGAGLAELFQELGVQTLDGGPTLNPSTYDLLAAIHEVSAEEVLVLPNSANVVMAAEHAAELSDKQVKVVPTTSQQAGLAAAVVLNPDRAVEQNAEAVQEALKHVRTGAVAPAARDDAQGRFTAGDAVGFVQDEVVAWGEPTETLRAILTALAGGDGESGEPELISVLAGEGAPLGLGEIEGMARGEVELELRQGGQPAYWWLLAAE
jgi:hypothetical protein